MSFRDSSPDEAPALPHPGVITAIAAARRQRGRFVISIDQRPSFTLAEEPLTRAGLAVGDVLDSEQIAALLAQDELSRSVEAALVFLAYRPRSEREVRDRLRRGSFSPEAIDQTISKLYEWRYLDDADFARRWVENRSQQRPRGQRLLQQELRQKGIAADTAREVIAEADLDEVAAAEALARRRLQQTAGAAGEDAQVVKRRLSAYLARRGYGFDVVRIALERTMGEPLEADEPGDEDEFPGERTP